MEFIQLKRNLKKDFSGFQTVKVAIVGDTATQLLSTALKGYGYELNINFDLFEADYNQIERQILDPASELYSFKPEFVIVFHSTQKMMKKFYKLPSEEREKFSEQHIGSVKDYYNTLLSRISCKVVYLNFCEVNDGVFGNYANKMKSSFLYQLRKTNFELMNVSGELKNLYVCDVASLASVYGSNFTNDHKIYINTDIVFSLDFLPALVKNISDIIKAVIGRINKCLILDLDNTLWGGVIGDDGIGHIQIGDLGIGKAFTELQHWAKELKERGIILAVCSKNNEEIAKDAFLNHPEMVLKLEDIAVFVANWDNKADNIKLIQSVLNIGFDSMVFLDDNPFERNIVRQYIPEITVPELPEDPAEYLSCLRTLNLFETASYSEGDKARTKQYQEEARRAIVQNSFVNEEAYLESLDMVSLVQPFDRFNISRVAQLTQRSNQYNLRTVRYTEDDILKLSLSDNHFTLSFTLEDKFGDNGLICVVVLEKRSELIFIDTWLMSCRVLKRGMENFVLNTIVEVCKNAGYKTVAGEYIPTLKNQMVKDHYSNLGFIQKNNFWEMDISQYAPKSNFIKSRSRELIS
jgi:FkbH-like protein